jgi:hypothetical protein
VIRLFGGIDLILVLSALLLVFSVAIGLGTWEERWHHSVSAVLWMSGLSGLALDLVGHLR